LLRRKRSDDRPNGQASSTLRDMFAGTIAGGV